MSGLPMPLPPMTETEWLRSADACAMLDHLFPQQVFDSTAPQTRKLRLYLVALARIAWRELPPVCQAVTEFIEAWADNPQVSPATLELVRQVAERMTTAWNNAEAVERCARELQTVGLTVPQLPPRNWPEKDWQRLTWLTFLPHWPERPPIRWVAPADHRADLVRDIFGNPFRAFPPLEPTWRTATVMQLAHSMYESRKFATMPILADALEEAGCTDAVILTHCREGRLHARGCWVVDLLLNRG